MKPAKRYRERERERCRGKREKERDREEIRQREKWIFSILRIDFIICSREVFENFLLYFSVSSFSLPLSFSLTLSLPLSFSLTLSVYSGQKRNGNRKEVRGGKKENAIVGSGKKRRIHRFY